MAKVYDATKEFKPFDNRKAGGALIEDAFGKHPRPRDGRRATSRGKPRGEPNVRTREVKAGTVTWTRHRDGFSW